MPETLEFKAELKQLLHLITHSLYSDPEIFLRELVSNAADAINKVRFDSLAHAERLEGNTDWKIRLTPDKEANTLTVSDNGIGMTRQEVIGHLGTIAQSGTRAFLEAARQKGASADVPGLIGQFGVGFYSAFMVADKVTVLTRPVGSPADGTRWESDGQGTFAVEPAEKPSRGTDVTLHLKEDAKEFLDPWRLRALVKKFSDFIEFPVVMETESEADGKTEKKEETLNTRKAVWLRRKAEVAPDEYAEFYKQLAHDTQPPAATIHYAAEGKTEFKVLMFVPAHRPLRFDSEEPAGLRLYVQRVLIMERCEQVLPPYLRFVRGVVDSADLPLNVSRELLQQNPLLDVIQKSVVKNVLDALAGMKNVEYEKYVRFFRGFGSVLKFGLGPHGDWANREKVADLLLFESANTAPEQFTTLAEYVEKMPAAQTAIHYLAGESAAQLRQSPYLEAFRARGEDVLLLTDPVDEYALPWLREYKGKKFEPADRAEPAAADDIPAETREKFAGLIAAFKEKVPEVADVRLSKRLTESAACLVTEAHGPSAHLERVMKQMGQPVGEWKRILELNPQNPAVEAVRELHSRTPSDPRVEAYARLIYDQAVLAEGSKVVDPSALAKRVNDLIARDARG